MNRQGVANTGKITDGAPEIIDITFPEALEG